MSVYELLLDRLASDKKLSARARQLVLAAFDGEQRFAAVLGGERVDDRPPERSQVAVAPPMFLSAIHVQGFRGIGPASTLALKPSAGLTVVTGGNGSGKSSFAEAAELVVTGDNKRWSAKENNQRLWRDGWRNLHGTPDGLACVGVDLAIAGESEPIALRLTWPKGTDLDAGKLTRQRNGATREAVDSPLWPDEVELYRPFLSYSELGALLDGKPTQLHAALYRLLGLGSLEAASERLKSIRGELDRRAKDIKDERVRLVGDLADIDDHRALRARSLLSKSAPDLAAVGALAVRDDRSLADIAALRTLTSLFVLSSTDVQAATGRVRTAIERLATIRTSDTARAGEVADLLRAALGHQAGQDCPCPVCGKGTLDADWRRRATAQVERLEQDTLKLRQATESLAAAVAAARLLVAAAPAALDVPPPAGVDLEPVRAAWRAWEQAGRVTDPAALADALDTGHARLVACLADLAQAAGVALAKLDEVWRPTAVRLAAWHEQAKRVADDAALLRDVRGAVDWLKDAGAELRDQRMAPFAAQSRAVWEQLRQQSDIDLNAVRLTGTGTMRKVVLDVTVDGTAGAALSVMSQGELHALALSLFLPRATVDESPFRFMVIDDPVQAMDTAKVEGLARVLAATAATRQVVVFTHDERLVEAVGRLGLAATVLRVCRGERSRVEVRHQ
jgi:ABC-type transport system involved in cytochrome c biogenesis ATPase subunit